MSCVVIVLLVCQSFSHNSSYSISFVPLLSNQLGCIDIQSILSPCYPISLIMLFNPLGHLVIQSVWSPYYPRSLLALLSNQFVHLVINKLGQHAIQSVWSPSPISSTTLLSNQLCRLVVQLCLSNHCKL